jgi:hypothetical protein
VRQPLVGTAGTVVVGEVESYGGAVGAATLCVVVPVAVAVGEAAGAVVETGAALDFEPGDDPEPDPPEAPEFGTAAPVDAPPLHPATAIAPPNSDATRSERKTMSRGPFEREHAVSETGGGIRETVYVRGVTLEEHFAMNFVHLCVKSFMTRRI